LTLVYLIDYLFLIYFDIEMCQMVRRKVKVEEYL